jgi:hypothetical protein
VTSPLTPDAVLRPAVTVAARQIDDGLVLVNLETGKCWELNPVGALIWEQLSRGESLGSVCLTVASRYSAAPEAVRSDTEKLVADLVAQGLLEREPALPPR